nr:transposase [Nonomuraea basaltis]
MSAIEGVGDQMSTTLGEVRSTVRGVAGEQRERRPIRELIDDRLLDELLVRSRDEAGGLRLTGEGSMLGDLVKVVLERALEAELTAHLGYTRHEQGAGAAVGNARNGKIGKTVQTGVGPVRLAVLRDRAGSFEPCWCPSGRAGSPVAWMTWSSRCTRTG